MSANRSWKVLLAAVAAAVVVGGGVGMSVLQLRAGDANEPGPPNIDTLSWVTERGAEGWIVRHPADWVVRPFDERTRSLLERKGLLISSKEYPFRKTSDGLTEFNRLPTDLAAVQIGRILGGPAAPAPPIPTGRPLILEEGRATPGSGGDMIDLPLEDGWFLAWIGSEVSRRDAEIVRRIVSSFGFETAPPAGSLTLEERMIAHEIAESYRGARTALKGRPHTHPEFATDQTGSAGCGGHKCGLVVFQITGGLRFRVLVDLVERRAIAFS